MLILRKGESRDLFNFVLLEATVQKPAPRNLSELDRAQGQKGKGSASRKLQD
jgi:hypothetical protein